MAKFRGITWNNSRFGPKIIIRRSIDMAELGDLGSIDENAQDLPTRGAAHRADHGGSTSATRGHTDLRGIAGNLSNVVDTQDMGLISETASTHRIWSSTGAITDIVTSAPTTLNNPPQDGGHLFTYNSSSSTGSYTFTVPAGITSISAVAVGAGGGGGEGSPTLSQYGSSGGGGGGGALAYANDISVSPGDVLYIEIGEGGNRGKPGGDGEDTILKKITGVDQSGNDIFENMLVAGGGAGGTTPWTHQQNTGQGGSPSGTEKDGGGDGGNGGGRSFWTNNGGAGGGAGGYSGDGGRGDGYGTQRQAGQGGGGGGGYAAGPTVNGLGGGVGLYGQGSSGAAGYGSGSTVHGGSGSGLQAFSGNSSDISNQYGAGGYGSPRSSYSGSRGGNGALRIIWGTNRAFPSTNVGTSSNTESLN